MSNLIKFDYLKANYNYFSQGYFKILEKINKLNKQKFCQLLKTS